MVTFKIEGGSVLMFRDGARIQGDLGTVLPDDEQLCRVLMRVFEAGRQDKAREIRKCLAL